MHIKLEITMSINPECKIDFRRRLSLPFGVAPEDCLGLVRQVAAMENIDLTGLMTVGPYIDDESIIRQAYASTCELFKQGRDIVGDDFDCLSMGMTGDFELGIAEGATMIRIGTLLFGPRQA